MCRYKDDYLCSLFLENRFPRKMKRESQFLRWRLSFGSENLKALLIELKEASNVLNECEIV